MRTWPLWGGTLALTVGAAHAQLDAQSQGKLVIFAAGMHEVAIACGHMPAQDVQAAQLKQRQAMLDQGMSVQQYEAAYGQGKRSFEQRWKGMDAGAQRSTCEQIKAQTQSTQQQKLGG